MKAVILAGGLGTRLGEETVLRPKPMVEIGGRPILWHIMKHFARYGVSDFIICCGYKSEVIKHYFLNYRSLSSDITIDVASGSVTYHDDACEPWRVTLADTGDAAMTGGRLLAVKRYLEDETDFLFTYGDGVGDVDIEALIAHHRGSGCMATVTAVEPPGRYGVLTMDGDRVCGFTEKPRGDGGWINGGFFVLNRAVFDHLMDSRTVWEGQPLETIARNGQLTAYRHHGFWRAMDTMRDKNYLQALWDKGAAPWKTW